MFSWTPCALFVFWSAFVLAAAGFSPDFLRSVNNDEANFTETEDAAQTPQKEQQVTAPLPGPAFDLKIRVVDALSGQPLSRAAVEVFINYTQTYSAHTDDDGGVWFNIPYRTGTAFSAVASKDGYVSTLLPIAAHRTPIFSSVTVSLLGVNRGNMWLFDDSVLVTKKSNGVFGAEPLVQFPRSRLNLTEDDALTAVTVFLNSPTLSASEETFVHTLGLVSSKSGYRSVELSPVASVSVLLISGHSAVNVTGPINMSLPLSDLCGLQAGDHVPAWLFNTTTGGWMRKGLGTVESVKGRLAWTFVAPHLGHWMAAPLSPSRGARLEYHVDFILRHASFLMILLGSTLAVAVCLLVGVLCRPRASLRETKPRSSAVNPFLTMKDQGTSTSDDEVFFHSNGIDNNQYSLSVFSDNVISNCNAELHQTKDTTVAISLDCTDQELENEASSQRKSANGLFFYNQPVAILHAPASFFDLDELTEQQWSKSATLPRTGASEALSKDSFTQTKSPTDGKQIAEEPEKGSESKAKPRAHCGLPESVSEPGTLSKNQAPAAGSAQGPRAWFVTLEGKPAAELRYSVSEEQRRRRAAESRDTSLDSGVDLSELNQNKRGVTLERNATFLKKSSNKKQTESED